MTNGARGAFGGLERVGAHGGVGVEGDETLGGRAVKDGIDMAGRVHAVELLARGARGLDSIQCRIAECPEARVCFGDARAGFRVPWRRRDGLSARRPCGLSIRNVDKRGPARRGTQFVTEAETPALVETPGH